MQQGQNITNDSDRKATEVVVAEKKVTWDTKIIRSPDTTKESETKWRVAGCVKVGGWRVNW